eukprot:8644502-Pyramimonas_sp.AAC.1
MRAVRTRVERVSVAPLLSCWSCPLLSTPANDHSPGAGVNAFGGPVRKSVEDEVDLAPIGAACNSQSAAIGTGERAVGQRLARALEVGGADDVEVATFK